METENQEHMLTKRMPKNAYLSHIFLWSEFVHNMGRMLVIENAQFQWKLGYKTTKKDWTVVLERGHKLIFKTWNHYIYIILHRNARVQTPVPHQFKIIMLLQYTHHITSISTWKKPSNSFQLMLLRTIPIPPFESSSGLMTYGIQAVQLIFNYCAAAATACICTVLKEKKNPKHTFPLGIQHSWLFTSRNEKKN